VTSQKLTATQVKLIDKRTISLEYLIKVSFLSYQMLGPSYEICRYKPMYSVFYAVNWREQAIPLTENRADFRSRVKTRYGDISPVVTANFGEKNLTPQRPRV
jgi:hypothetical protein